MEVANSIPCKHFYEDQFGQFQLVLMEKHEIADLARAWMKENSLTETESTQLNTPTASEYTPSESKVNQAVASTYVTVVYNKYNLDPSLFRLQDHTTAEGFTNAIFKDCHQAPVSKVSIKYSWWSDKWFNFRCNDEEAFGTILDIIEKYRGEEDCILQVEISG